MFCANCGFQIPDNANFCPECGNSINIRLNKLSEENMAELKIRLADIKAGRNVHEHELIEVD